MEPSLDLPVISNFHGSVAIGSDLLSMAALVTPPLSMGYNLTTPLVVSLSNGSQMIALAEEVLFSPHTGYRFGPLGSSASRMAFEQNLLLIEVDLDSEVRSASVELYAMLRYYPPASWTWIYPAPQYPANNGDYNSYLTDSAPNQILVIEDSLSSACGAFFSPNANYSLPKYPQSIYWNFSDTSAQIRLAYAFGQSCTEAIDLVRSTIGALNWIALWNETEELWEERWQAAFTQGNSHFSGYVPVLETADEETSR